MGKSKIVSTHVVTTVDNINMIITSANDLGDRSCYRTGEANFIRDKNKQYIENLEHNFIGYKK